jgi:CBS domain-containing protein
MTSTPQTEATQNGAGILQPVLDFLRRHAPFDLMQASHLEFLAKRLQLVFYARGERITDPEGGPAQRFVIIKQGSVRGERPSEDEQISGNAWELTAGECFPIGALLSRRPVRTVHRAAEDTFCFELDRDDFEALLKQSVVFSDFCTRRLASLLDQVQQQVQADAVQGLSGESALHVPIRRCIRREPVTCPADTPLRTALQTMQDERVGSIIAVDEGAHPLGVFTLHDLLDRVALPATSLDQPLSTVMTPDPVTVTTDAYAYEAAILMAERGFGHICVVDKGRLVGVLSERDVFSLQRVGLVHLTRSIDGADDIATLARLAGEVRPLVGQLIAQGVKVAQIMQMITLVNDRVTRRVIELCIAEHGDPGIDYTWLSFGSEGRCEQTLKTDQDNGIIFTTPQGLDPEAARGVLLPLALKINHALDACGFPLCTGNVMASNPECCLTLDEWKGRFARWIDQGTPEHILKSTIYFDFRPLHGAEGPARELRDWLTERAEPNSRFRRQMAANAMAFRPPLGLIRDFKVSSNQAHPNTLDLKAHGITPFTDAARIFALANRVPATNTVQRLRAAAAAGALDGDDVAAWVSAYHYIQLLRMRIHQDQLKHSTELSNRIDPDALNELDRRILKEAFRQGRKLQSKLATDYQL